MERMRSDRVGVRGCRPAVTTNYSIDEVFRTEWSRVVAVLVRDFGDLELAEDCAQDAFMNASERWGSGEAVPDRPGAWLTTTARRKAIDVIRRSSSYDKKLVELEVRAKRGPERSASGELIDDQLNLLLGSKNHFGDPLWRYDHCNRQQSGHHSTDPCDARDERF